jgi:alpha-tubulin suppressor-like RCC1 family protein
VNALDGKNIAQVACGDDFSLAMSLDGKLLYSFGLNDDGQLGIGRSQGGSEVVYTPHQVNLPSLPLTAIVAGGWHALAITATHEVYTWGLNDYYQTGHEEEEIVYFPRFFVRPSFADNV